MTTNTPTGPQEEQELLLPSIPSRLPDGRRNPEYHKARRERLKKEGKLVDRSPEYWKEYREKRKAAGNPVKSPEAIKRYNDSEKGKAARARHEANPKRKKRRRKENGEIYASRIIREMEEKQNNNTL